MLLHSTFAFYPDKALRLLGLGDPHHPGKLLGFPPRDIHQSPKILVSRPKNVHLDENRDKEMKNKTRKSRKMVSCHTSYSTTLAWRCCSCILFNFSDSHCSGYCNPFFASAPGLSMTLLHFCVAAWHGSARWRLADFNGNLRTNWGNTLALKPFRPPFTAMIPFLPSIPGSEGSSTGASTGLPQLGELPISSRRLMDPFNI